MRVESLGNWINLVSLWLEGLIYAGALTVLWNCLLNSQESYLHKESVALKILLNLIHHFFFPRPIIFPGDKVFKFQSCLF